MRGGTSAGPRLWPRGTGYRCRREEGRPGPLHRLTAREREVLVLLADGATDREIAATLVISPRTASIHVGNILAKLDVPNRGAAAALARDLG